MQEKFKDFQILHGKEEKVNPKLTAYQVELAQVEAEIEKLLDTLTRANATLLAYACLLYTSFTRLRASTLGDGYDLQDVLAAIEGKEKRSGRPERKISLAVDIQAKLAAEMCIRDRASDDCHAHYAGLGRLAGVHEFPPRYRYMVLLRRVPCAAP